VVKYIYSGIRYVVQLQLLDLPKGLQVSEGSTDSLPPVIVLNRHNIRPPLVCLATASTGTS